MTLKADAPARSLSLAEADPEIAQAVRNEEDRQNDGLELIASENIASRAVLQAKGARIALHSDEAYKGHPWYNALVREGVARGIGAELRIRVRDVDAGYSRALNLGALAIEYPNDLDGTRECQVMGPDGFLLALWQPAPE